MEVASAVRLPSPEPELDVQEPPRKRDRSPYDGPSAGPSKRSRREDEGNRENGRGRDEDPQENGGIGPRPPPKPTTNDLPADDSRLNLFRNAFSASRKLPIDDSKTRAGGTYIPPARLREMQKQITDKKSAEFQRMAWEALKKSIQGLINKTNTANIKMIVPELFSENLIRGRGLFCRAMMKAQAASLPFTPIYGAMVAIVNTKLPQVGDLLVRRLIVQFRKSFRRNDKAVCLSSTTFLSHLVNTQVVHEVLIAEILLLLLNKPSDDSVEIAVGIMKEVGAFLDEMNPAIANAIFDQMRNILHEADIDKRTQYMIEVLFEVRRTKYKEHPTIKEDLDLVEEEDQITHRHTLEDELKVEDGLNIFKLDADYEEHEAEYQKIKAEILGEAEGSDDEDGTDASSEDEDDEEDKAMDIKDQTNADLVSLRRSIYLTIKSSGGFEECCHKLMRINLPQGLESELTTMIVECASQERTYEKFYGMIGERFCKLNRMWTDLFEEGFAHYYETIHRFETNRLRIIAQFFAHLLASDGVGWHVFTVIKLNEEDTTSSSRIFIKILFEELLASLGQKAVVQRFKDPMLQESLTGIFPTDADDQSKTRFSINFFTAIGMGVLTEGMREWLKNAAPKPKALPEPESDSDDSRSVSSRSSSSYSRSRSRSRSPVRKRRDSRSSSRGRSYTRTPSPARKRGARGRSDSYSSASRSRSRSRSPAPRKIKRNYSSSRSRSPPKRRGRSPSDSRSRSPPPKSKRRGRSPSDSLSRSPPPRRRKYSTSPSRSPSPPPRRRRDSSSPPPKSKGKGKEESVSPVPEKKRRYSSSVSRSPPPRRRRDS
ncbi:MIF4G-domain-containing protein [Cucurbitaria berberidis CBS 394.84]|uniref:Pre-mRNA-splicing factor CWC22 n=1 Tax=Cucurbitaria berberidis CBS 394.84 TaxID=1168544 RepID=A0A9P4G9F5_9PLEO|nr:MIF4G-domain-containing protein [Cucurbitaria berberidis CBS 394.84]KAF1841593.1 MIF4G-domain-containing protein [Cucurbitaria berberidis CBS 394.84]